MRAGRVRDVDYVECEDRCDGDEEVEAQRAEPGVGLPGVDDAVAVAVPVGYVL